MKVVNFEVFVFKNTVHSYYFTKKGRFAKYHNEKTIGFFDFRTTVKLGFFLTAS